MNEAKILLWDFDGTLGYRPGRWSGALAAVIDEHPATTPLTAESFRPLLRSGFPWHRPEMAHLQLTTAELWWAEMEQVLANAYVQVGFTPEQATHYARLAHTKYLEPAGWSLYDDVRPVLNQLADLGWSHVILSNHVPELAQIVEAIGLGSHVSQVFTSACIGYEKPHPEAFRVALSAMGNYQQVWMIGDSYEADVVGAEAVGIPAILVRNSASAAKRCCQSLYELTRFLR